MKITKKAETQPVKNHQVNEPGRYYDGQKGWLSITGYRREGVKQGTRKDHKS
jgi:hypothetical protein